MSYWNFCLFFCHYRQGLRLKLLWQMLIMLQRKLVTWVIQSRCSRLLNACSTLVKNTTHKQQTCCGKLKKTYWQQLCGRSLERWALICSQEAVTLSTVHSRLMQFKHTVCTVTEIVGIEYTTSANQSRTDCHIVMALSLAEIKSAKSWQLRCSIHFLMGFSEAVSLTYS